MTETSSTGALLQVDPQLRGFVDGELLAGLDLEPTSFWSTVGRLHERFAGRVEELLRRRDELQERIDGWHREHGPGDLRALETFLTEIGYLLPLEQPVVRVTGGGSGDLDGGRPAAGGASGRAPLRVAGLST